MFLDRNRIRPFFAMAAAGVVASALAVASAPATALPTPDQSASVKLPDTTPGKCARAFFDMLNNPTPEVVAAFEKTWASKQRASSRSIDERVQSLVQMKQEHGSYTITSILSASDDSIVISVDGANGQAAEMEFNFSPNEAGKLDAVMIASGGGRGAPTKSISPAERETIINDTLNALREGYVYPEVAEQMAAAVEAKLKAGEYDSIADDVQLARTLTMDLRAVSHDGHLGVRVMPAPPQSAASEDDDADMGPPIDMMRRNNFGFVKAELLPGNIGYLRFDFFADHDEAREIASAALAFMQYADALVFDMRYNGGGSPEMIRYITSYLFDSPTHLNSMIDRNGEVVEEYWTLEDVPGKRFANDLPVYVLTSSRSFSGAEEFTYNLKNLKRGVVVGETTGGGAHPVRGERVSDRIVIGVPFMRAFNPISKTNWEGTGVTPDVACSADEALDTATQLAREAIERRHQDD